MSDALGDYESGGEIHLGAKLLAEVSKFQVNHMNNLSKVNTIKKGFAGTADGPQEVEITITTAIPKSGMEVDYIDVLRSRRVVTFRRKLGGRTLSYSCKCDGFDETGDAAAAAEGSCKLIGKLIGSAT